MLASINSNDPQRIADMLRRALAKWETLSRAERLLPDDPGKQSADVRRAERHYPKDGLVLYVNTRDLPRDTPVLNGWRGQAWNQDYAWFTRQEARQFLPEQLQVGRKHDLPAPLLHRLACAHLVDNVRGQTEPFDEGDIQAARLTAEVTAVDGDTVTLRLEGETRAAAAGPPAQPHGLEARLLGKATYDAAKGRFTAFELVAVGTRSGGTRFNFRRGDLGAAPIGVVFTLAGDSPAERVAPAFHYHRVYRPVVARGN
jgi:hypothetical protein